MANFNVATMEYWKRAHEMKSDIIISVVGLGYVGLPVAVAFSKIKYKIIGYDVNKERINKLSQNQDDTGEVTENELKNSDKLTDDVIMVLNKIKESI